MQVSKNTFTYGELRLRGWTKELLRESQICGITDNKIGEITYYDERDVFRFERTRKFKSKMKIDEHLITSEHRRFLHFKELIDASKFNILTFSNDILMFKESVEHFNLSTGSKVEFSPKLKMVFLRRIAKNMLRHTSVVYIDFLDLIKKEKNRRMIYGYLRHKIKEEIEEKYSTLKEN